mgnify:CR=1 FL=1
MKKKPNSAELRYGSVTVDDVRVFATIVSESADDLTRVADEMAAVGSDRLPIDGAKKFTRGQKLLAEFVGHLEVSLAKARADVRAARQAADAVRNHDK